MKVPEKDLENALAIMGPLGYETADLYLDILLGNGMEFAGATKDEATFIDKDGFRVVLLPDDGWRVILPGGEVHEAHGVIRLGEIIDPWLRKM